MFVSIDEKEDDVAEYKKAHSDPPTTLRLVEPEKKMSAWFKELDLIGNFAHATDADPTGENVHSFDRALAILAAGGSGGLAKVGS